MVDLQELTDSEDFNEGVAILAVVLILVSVLVGAVILIDSSEDSEPVNTTEYNFSNFSFPEGASEDSVRLESFVAEKNQSYRIIFNTSETTIEVRKSPNSFYGFQNETDASDRILSDEQITEQVVVQERIITRYNFGNTSESYRREFSSDIDSLDSMVRKRILDYQDGITVDAKSVESRNNTSFILYNVSGDITGVLRVSKDGSKIAFDGQSDGKPIYFKASKKNMTYNATPSWFKTGVAKSAPIFGFYTSETYDDSQESYDVKITFGEFRNDVSAVEFVDSEGNTVFNATRNLDAYRLSDVENGTVYSVYAISDDGERKLIRKYTVGK